MPQRGPYVYANPGRGAALHLADISKDVSYRIGNERAKAIVDQFGIHTLLTVPLRKEETLLGGFVLYRLEAKPFSDKQISLVQNFAAQAVIAMENARLLNELRKSLQQQTATADVLKAIAGSGGELAARVRDHAGKCCTNLRGELRQYVALRRRGLPYRALHGPLPPAFVEKWRSGTLFVPGLKSRRFVRPKPGSRSKLPTSERIRLTLTATLGG